MRQWIYVFITSLLFIFNTSSFAASTQLNNIDKNTPYIKLFLGMNAVPMVVWTDKGEVISANNAYLKMLGYTLEDMQGGKVDWKAATPSEYISLDQHCVQQLKNQPYCTPYVKEYVRKDGKRISVKLWNARDEVKGGQNIAIILPLESDLN